MKWKQCTEKESERVDLAFQTKTEWKIHCIRCWTNLFDLCFLSLGWVFPPIQHIYRACVSSAVLSLCVLWHGTNESTLITPSMYPVLSAIIFVFGFTDLPSLKTMTIIVGSKCITLPRNRLPHRFFLQRKKRKEILVRWHCRYVVQLACILSDCRKLCFFFLSLCFSIFLAQTMHNNDWGCTP